MTDVGNNLFQLDKKVSAGVNARYKLKRKSFELCLLFIHSRNVEVGQMNNNLNPEDFRTIVESSVDAVVIINRDGDIIFWNKSAELMFGYSETDVLGKYVHDVLPVHSVREKADESFNKFKKKVMDH